jgi:hypothetical protein
MDCKIRFPTTLVFLRSLEIFCFSFSVWFDQTDLLIKQARGDVLANIYQLLTIDFLI